MVRDVVVGQDVLFELILAANYIGIKPLLDMTRERTQRRSVSSSTLCTTSRQKRRRKYGRKISGRRTLNVGLLPGSLLIQVHLSHELNARQPMSVTVYSSTTSSLFSLARQYRYDIIWMGLRQDVEPPTRL
jgi:hypothetical protein